MYEKQCHNIHDCKHIAGMNNIKFQFYIHVLNIKYDIELNTQILFYIICYRIIYCSTIQVVLDNTTRN